MLSNYMNFTNFSIHTLVEENELFICTFIFLCTFFYIVLLQIEIDDLRRNLEKSSEYTNPTFTLNSLKNLEKRLISFHKRLNVFHTRVKTLIKKVVTNFNMEQEQLKLQMDEKEQLYNNNIKTILQLSRNPIELQNYLESIGYHATDDEEYDSHDDDEDSDTEIVLRKRPRREAAPVTFKKFFNDSEDYDSDESYVPPNKKKL